MGTETKVWTAKTKTTGETIPFAAQGIVLEITGEMNTSDGVAFRAIVTHHGIDVGTIENEGRGGGTWFRPASGEARAWWEELVKRFAEIKPDEYSHEEALADLLYDDAALAKFLNRKRNAVFRRDGDNVNLRILNGPPDEKAREFIREHFLGDGAVVEMWVKNKGWEVVNAAE
jgi:hypothetical protein